MRQPRDGPGDQPRDEDHRHSARDEGDVALEPEVLARERSENEQRPQDMERDVVERLQVGPIAAPVAVPDRDDQEDRAYYRNDAFEDEHSRWSALRAHCD